MLSSLGSGCKQLGLKIGGMGKRLVGVVVG